MTTNEVQTQKTESDLFKKNNQLIAMVPLTELDAISRKLYNAVLKETYRQSLEVKKTTGNWPLANHEFVSPLADLLTVMGYKDGNDGSVVNRAISWLKKMESTQVDWMPTGRDVEVKYKNIRMLAQTVLYKRGRQYFVEWALPPKIIDLVWSFDSFTILNLAQIAKLKSYASCALYEIFARYKGVCSTSSHTTDWWASVVLQNPNASREWRKVKSEQIKKAVLEINELTDLLIDGPIEKREGGPRSPVVGVHFNIRVKKKDGSAFETKEISPEEKIPVEISLLAEKQKVLLKSVRSVIKEYPSLGMSIAHNALLKMSTRVDSIENTNAYFMAVSREIAEKGGVVRSEPAQTLPIIQPVEAPQKSEKELAREKAKERMLQLPHDELLVFAEKALNKIRKSLTPRSLQDFESFKNKNRAIPPLLVSAALDFYLEEQE